MGDTDDIDVEAPPPPPEEGEKSENQDEDKKSQAGSRPSSNTSAKGVCSLYKHVSSHYYFETFREMKRQKVSLADRAAPGLQTLLSAEKTALVPPNQPSHTNLWHGAQQDQMKVLSKKKRKKKKRTFALG